mmetsp:Transcript_38747/g.97607  ORF Transcript_38747/g.97607 Transcript_38747/m.97607 type:complete len:85 (-) Transcript_38747:56-310(-)
MSAIRPFTGVATGAFVAREAKHVAPFIIGFATFVGLTAKLHFSLGDEHVELSKHETRLALWDERKAKMARGEHVAPLQDAHAAH